MKVLVTGSKGFIGAYVKEELEDLGHTLVPFDLPQSVLNPEELKEAVAGIDGVINLAGVLGTSEIFGAEKEAAEVNIIGAVNVADACRLANIPVVQIGTGHKGQPNPYAITKACAEDLLLVMDVKVNVVRAYHAYGPLQKPCIPFGRSKVKKIMPTFICRALSGEPIEINGSGNQIIDLVYAGDIAKVLVDALSEPYGRTIEAGTGHGTSVIEAAKYIQKEVQNVELIHKPMRKGEPENTTVIASKPECHNIFPYKMEETIQYYRHYLSSDGSTTAR